MIRLGPKTAAGLRVAVVFLPAGFFFARMPETIGASLPLVAYMGLVVVRRSLADKGTARRLVTTFLREVRETVGPDTDVLAWYRTATPFGLFPAQALLRNGFPNAEGAASERALAAFTGGTLSTIDTALLLGGVGALALAIGTGTAWLISLYDFRGRQMLTWLMPLPLAIPTYMAAYVYVDLFEPLGLVHRTLAVWFPLRDAVLVLPNLRSLPGAIMVIGFVLYPYVYLSARAMFQFQSAEFTEVARTLGANRWSVFWRVSLPMARPALAVGVALVSLETLNDIGASEYLGVRTLTVSVFTTWLNRGSLAGAAQLSCFMLAIVAGLIAGFLVGSHLNHLWREGGAALRATVESFRRTCRDGGICALGRVEKGVIHDQATHQDRG
jgi:ABC-type sulfate transport system permease component